ncbi:MAG: HDOD domain-containing protein [Proteobacteria bacterium]|nr:HDOD domain-containing protein [Pseudomonadota bacterium]MBU1387687.1 HDOD domain-containing protein [Pseudomonadota bacterium]MBU1543719.1 HDOD domain-containing protein [Pseudomonadota bacterium]MBU2482218.1 HDOD domain-containing protein [Pseudomonadota bacterium]
MSDTLKPHQGIELDGIDFSQFNTISRLQSASPGQAYDRTLDFKIFIKDILTKILKNDSFLSFSNQITDVNKILSMKYSSASDIADVILKDVALTSKLLKLVNSSFYGQFSHKGIATISEAMIILGTEEIKLAAASLKIYELMQNIATIAILKDKTLKALQRSLIARQIAVEEGIPDAEAIQISAMLYDFGEYLVALFSPGTYINIELLAEDKNISREQAAKEIIGIPFNNLGRYIATKWHLPPSIINAMKPVFDFNTPKNRISSQNLHRYICSFTNELCHIEFSKEHNNIGGQIIAISATYKKCLDIQASRSVELLKTSWDRITKHAAILKVDTTRKADASRN